MDQSAAENRVPVDRAKGAGRPRFEIWPWLGDSVLLPEGPVDRALGAGRPRVGISRRLQTKGPVDR